MSLIYQVHFLFNFSQSLPQTVPIFPIARDPALFPMNEKKTLIIVLLAPVQSRPCTPCAGTSIRYKQTVPNREEEEIWNIKLGFKVETEFCFSISNIIYYIA